MRDSRLVLDRGPRVLGRAAVAGIGVLLIGASCGSSHESIWEEVYSHREHRKKPAVGPASQPVRDRDKQAVPVPPPPFSEGVFPCSECHEPDEVNLKRRELEDEHEAIKLHHGDRDRWCFDCHNPTDRDKLRLASGRLVPFERSYLLCGQCHGPKLRDWRAGVHGKRTGRWDGVKKYRLCVHCHNPHSPRFKKLKPKPRPRRPGENR